MSKSDPKGFRVMVIAGLGVAVAAAGALSALAQPAPLDPGPVPRGNHYQCYTAAQQGAFRPRKVTLADQFGRREVTLTGVTRICNPVDKRATEGAGAIVDKSLHLVCYKFGAQQPTKTVRVRNQFGLANLMVTSPSELCLPSSKMVLR